MSKERHCSVIEAIALLIFSNSLVHADIDRTNCIRLGGQSGDALSCNEGFVGIGTCSSGDINGCGTGGESSTTLTCCRDLTYEPGDIISCMATATPISGAKLECSLDSALTSICGSNSERDCGGEDGGYYTTMGCCNVKLNVDPSSGEWVYAAFGDNAMCEEGFVAYGFCGSGTSGDCAGRTQDHGVYCVPHD